LKGLLSGFTDGGVGVGRQHNQDLYLLGAGDREPPFGGAPANFLWDIPFPKCVDESWRNGGSSG
jgi:hypothetical protein